MSRSRPAAASRRPRILIVSYTRTDQEPRILKQIAEFSQRYDVVTAGYGPPPAGVTDHIELETAPRRSGLALVPGIFSLFLLLRLHGLYSRLEPRDRSARRQLQGGGWDVVVAHDAGTMYLASTLAAAPRILADMHEYAPKQSLPSLRWNLLYKPYYTWICRRYVARAGAVTTVSSGIVDEYRRVFGIESTLVVNATPFHDLRPGAVGRTVRLVHSGGVAPQRRLDIMIDGVRQSRADVSLDLYLVDDGDGSLLRHLRELAAPDLRIRILDPVPYRELVPTLNDYDLGLSIFPPTTFNLAWCLPNKFFDYVQARLGVVVGPSPEMQRFVEAYGIGLVLPDFTPTALAAALDDLTASQVDTWKHASDGHVHELSGEEQGKVWGRVVDGILAATTP